jgi:hypothetical protein
MKKYNGQNQAFPTDAPQALQLEKAFAFKPNGDIEISTWLDRQVRKFVPAARKLNSNSRQFKNVCVNWYRKREKQTRQWKQSHVPKRSNFNSMGVELDKALVLGGFRASL